ncbi:GspH/FimT family pseudopilin [Vibrio litoralis]|uniref:GspH/FimT family pseudopilin n=1 Tax=Vibrio litoralis TaxID=335972 RepID=UPI00048781F8|nr:GspH/FimT family pseudopilin [Vibrio litoralis]
MARGFTLIEMLISLVVLAVLLAAAVPSFSGMSERSKMQRLAEELQGFWGQAKSEAVLRNQELYLHFVQDGAAYAGEWALVTNTSPTAPSDRHAAKVNALTYLDGAPFKNITVNYTASSTTTIFDRVNGRPTQNGNIQFSVDSIKPLMLKFHNRSSTRICSVTGGAYGYPEC